MHYAEIFEGFKGAIFMIVLFYNFLIFAQDINCGYTLEPPHYHNLCFRAKVRKMYTPVNPYFII